MPLMATPTVKIDWANLPKTSLLRLYHPQTQGNSFSLDGFPALKGSVDWLTRLVEVIETQGVLGMTTNQTLFRQLMETGALDERLRAFKAQGRSPQEIYQILYNEAVTLAASAFGPIHARWPWEGRVSQEASALLTELEPLVKDVERIAGAMAGVGAFTKIPNLPIGPRAIERAVTSGRVCPNVTLVFSDRHYIQTVEGYLLGLKARVDALKKQGASESEIRQEISQIVSVNSLFVSRVDRVTDPMIEERLPLLKGKVAVAQGKKIYQLFEAIFLGLPLQDPEGLYADSEGKALLATVDRLRGLYGELKKFAAHPQRLLIASSGVKSDQPYSPLLYVLPFLGPWCANTLPEGTLEAFSRFVSQLSDEEVASLKNRNLMHEPMPALPTDHTWDRAVLMTPAQRRADGIGEMTPDKILRDAYELIFKPRGTSLRSLCDTLRDKGAASFTTDEQATLTAIQTKLQTL